MPIPRAMAGRVKGAGGAGKAGAGDDGVVVEGGHGGFRRAKGSSPASRGDGNVWRVKRHGGAERHPTPPKKKTPRMRGAINYHED
ncbi:hypothetical protein CBM2605_A60004 [Cupriavidus neocaledonicus]|uniref:Uncharacterized protein n=1 Tax=Cupriavidus neocaledonicus TaxID=1040979 RepID=A0ABY1V244_9BURK|nr:hypothetical protein CBM2605_A60004 [Cupriavidus neocaledonicus]